jgi:hypothetical protein
MFITRQTVMGLPRARHQVVEGAIMPSRLANAQEGS